MVQIHQCDCLIAASQLCFELSGQECTEGRRVLHVCTPELLPQVFTPGLQQESYAQQQFAPFTLTVRLAGQQACVCRPTISALTADSITLAVDKPLRKCMLSSEVCWRIDKDEVSSIFTRMRCNLFGTALASS